MKNQSLFATFLIGSFAIFLIGACDGCQDVFSDWIREATVNIPDEDQTPPIIWFEVIDAKTGSTQTITTDSELVKNPGDVLNVNLWAEDNESGIKELCISSGFQVECCSIDSSPRICSRTQTLGSTQCQDFSHMTNRAFKKWFILNKLTIVAGCQDNFELESASYGFSGTVENFLGGTASINLSIRTP